MRAQIPLASWIQDWQAYLNAVFSVRVCLQLGHYADLHPMHRRAPAPPPTDL